MTDRDKALRVAILKLAKAANNYKLEARVLRILLMEALSSSASQSPMNLADVQAATPRVRDEQAPSLDEELRQFEDAMSAESDFLRVLDEYASAQLSDTPPSRFQRVP